jgi:hypothetical protein
MKEITPGAQLDTTAMKERVFIKHIRHSISQFIIRLDLFQRYACCDIHLLSLHHPSSTDSTTIFPSPSHSA